jgi:head-tail adaptor
MAQRGKYKEEISIQSRTATQDGQGGYITEWATIATEWSRVTEVSYDRILLDGGVKFNRVCQFELRRRGDTYTLTGNYRIYWDSKAYTIYSTVENLDEVTVLAYVEAV